MRVWVTTRTAMRNCTGLEVISSCFPVIGAWRAARRIVMVYVSVRLDRQNAGERARRTISRPNAAVPGRRAERRGISPPALAQRPVHPTPRPDVAGGDSLRLAVLQAAARAGEHCTPLRSRLRPFHDPAKHPVQLAQARGGS